MKKFIQITLVALLLAFTTSCGKEKVTLPYTDLTNYISVRIDIWYTIHGPMKAEYYLDMGDDQVPMHPWQEVIDRWTSGKPWYPVKNIYVTKEDYLIYL